MDTYKRHKRTFRLLMPLTVLPMRLLFGYRYEKVPKTDEPMLMLCNHNTDYDCILAGLAAGRQSYFVITEKIARMGILGKFVTHCFGPILHHKGMQGMATIKEIFRHMKAGHSVTMFPEGNRSFNGLTCPIPPATGKMARSCGGTLVTYRFTGGYFSYPRWGKGIRKGRIEGHVANLYTHEMLKAMSDEEIRKAIERDLFVDAYEDQEKAHLAFKGKRRAEGLESTLFWCPKCKKIGGLHSKDDKLTCECGWSVRYDEYGYLCGAKGETNTITELDNAQREFTEALFDKEDDQSPLFADTVTFERISDSHETLKSEVTLMEAYRDRFVIGDTEVMFSDINGLAINQRNLLLLHCNGKNAHLECSGPASFCALKYLYLFRKACGSRNGVL